LEHSAREGEFLTSPPDDVVAVSIRSDDPVSREEFQQAVAALGKRLLRLKGNVDFGDGDRRFVEVVYDTLTEREASPGLAGSTAFTAIGWRIGVEELGAAFDAAVGR
jgi:G3E family GTPase